MEQRIKKLKTASKVISVITKISYSILIAVLGICASMLIFMAATGGETSMLKLGGTNVIIYDAAASTPAEISALCVVLMVMGGMFLAIFLLAFKMFHEISLTGKPFDEKYAKTVRVIGILTAATPIAVGFAEGIVAIVSKAEVPEIFNEMPGIVIGAIIFCLSYIIDYGCGLENKETL